MVNWPDTHTVSRFDPFRSRLCRDVRNQLSTSLLTAIEKRDTTPAHLAADKFLSCNPGAVIKEYIHNRLNRYRTVIEQIVSARITADETYAIALLLWDQELFFEFHDWLEKEWLKSSGNEKRILQALIRSAGTYLLLENGKKTGAQKTAAKAVAALTLLKGDLPSLFDVSVLISKLENLDPVPPKFGAKEMMKTPPPGK